VLVVVAGARRGTVVEVEDVGATSESEDEQP
jgi:hypothetical protein